MQASSQAQTPAEDLLATAKSKRPRQRSGSITKTKEDAFVWFTRQGNYRTNCPSKSNASGSVAGCQDNRHILQAGFASRSENQCICRPLMLFGTYR